MKKVLLLLGIACIFVFMGCGQEEKAEQSPQKKAGEAVESVKEESGKTVESAKKEARGIAESVKEKTGEAVGAMKEKAGEAAETIKKEAGETVEKVKQKTGEAETTGAIGVMRMKNEKAFSSHRMGIVEFDHRAHVDEYGLGCGQCHHDKNGQPLNDLSYDSPVQGCMTCHDKKGRPMRDESMTPEQWREERLKYYYGAIHENCMGCHKKTKGPTRCTECHPRPEGR